jgi:hypothetical protein
MLNPNHDSKSPLSSRVALPVALMLAGIFGLGIAMVQPVAVSKTSMAVSAPTAPTAQNAPAPAETPAKIEDQPLSNGQELVTFCSRHVTANRSFVIFKRGTCVVINEPCEDPVAEAHQILSNCKDPEARFLSETSSEGDLIVAFKEPVFHRFSKGDMATMQPWLKESAIALLTPNESVAAGEGWSPPQDASIGLLARRRMLEDASDAVPVKVIRAKERVLAAN